MPPKAQMTVLKHVHDQDFPWLPTLLYNSDDAILFRAETAKSSKICLMLDYMYLHVCIRNRPLPIGAFQDQCKQTVINKHNLVKNSNWWEADQLAIYKRSREVELGATESNIS